MNQVWQWINKNHEPLLLGVFILIAFFYGLGSYALENVNEGLYGEIPREMLLSGNFVIPHLNFVPYIEKPPLLYWLTAASYYLFGISEFSARLIPALSASVVVTYVYHFMRQQKMPAAFLTGLMLSTSVAFILVARVIIFDMLLCACFTIAVLSFYRWHQEGKKSQLRIAYLAFALALLTKGLLSLVLLPAIVLGFLLWERSGWKKFSQLFDPIGIVLFFLVAAPWHILASIRLPEFAWQYFINEHVLRFLNLRIPNDYHHGPWYFYLPRLFLYIAPWSLFMPLLAARQPKYSTLQRLLWLWFLVPLVFFSLSQAKGDYYMIIALPALIMLLAIKMQAFFTTKRTSMIWWIFAITVMLEIILIGSLTLGAYRFGITNFLPDKLLLEPFLAEPLLHLFIATIFIGVVGLWCAYQCRAKLIVPFALFASLMLAPIQFLVIDKQQFQAQHSTIHLAKLIIKDTHTPVYTFRDYEELSTINFYTKKRIAIVDSISSDLYFGAHQPDAKQWFIRMSDLKKRLGQGNAYIITKSGNVPSLREALSDFTLCEHRSGRTSMLTKCHL